VRRDELDGERAWEEDHTTPLAALGEVMARVGVEVGRHVQPEALYQQVLRETGVWQDYDIPLGAPAKQVTP
jgi:hypothetical protein